MTRAHTEPARRLRREGVRVTKVGLWYVLFAVIVAIAATNTGNNALYMVLAGMLALLVVSWLVAKVGIRGLWITVEPPPEIFANTPASFAVEVGHRGRIFRRRQLVVQILEMDVDGAEPLVVARLGRPGEPDHRHRAVREVLFRRRGQHPSGSVRIMSLFPMGLFRASRRFALPSQLLVYPEIFDAGSLGFADPGELGEDSTQRVGWGHEVYGLRPFRAGDDPRSIHWKQTARVGELIFKERESEESRRFSVILDNGIGEARDETLRRRFERLVSEAATVCVEVLRRGFEVELVARDRHVSFDGGPRQRRELLECLALIEPCSASGRPPRRTDPTAPQLRLVLDGGEDEEPGVARGAGSASRAVG